MFIDLFKLELNFETLLENVGLFFKYLNIKKNIKWKK